MKTGIAKWLCLVAVAWHGMAFGGPVDACRQTAERYQRAILAADVHALYNLLPTAHQKTLVQLASTFASKVDDGTWKALQGCLLQTSGAMVKQFPYASEMLLENDVLPKGLQPDEAQTVTALWGGRIAAFAKTTSRQKLAAGGLESMLDIPGLMMSGVKERLSPLNPSPLTARDLGNGRVAIRCVDVPETDFVFEQVDGKWIPASWNRRFAGQAPGVIRHIQGWRNSPTTQLGLQQTASVLRGQASRALNAGSRAEFREAVRVATAPFDLLMRLL